jgi:hypothetical protein
MALVAANVAPVFGVLFAGWGVFPLVFLYWVENVVIGLFTVLKMLSVRPNDPDRRRGKSALTALFVFHYGAFVFGHGVFLMVIFASQRPDGTEGRAAFENLFGQIANVGLLLAAVPLLASHAWSFVTNYLRVERHSAQLKQLAMAPYGRVILLHLFIIGSAWLVMKLGSPLPVLLLFVALKTTVDLLVHLYEHRRAHG